MPARTNGELAERREVTIPPINRGRLWYDDEIPGQFFRNRVTVRWVREHLPRPQGIKIGRQWAWYEVEILKWLEQQRGARRAD